MSEVRIWEIVKGMCDGLYGKDTVFINTDNDEIFISDDGELLDLEYCTVVPMLTNDVSIWRVKE